MSFDKRMLEEILRGIPDVKVGIIGDACVDIYWKADMRKSELSREVPMHPRPVTEERFSLGAGSNAVNNLAAMGAKDVRFVSCIGEDWRGAILKDCLKQIGVSDRYLVKSARLVTPAYCKPVLCGYSDVTYEDSRIDFENREPMPEDVKERLRANFHEMAAASDIILAADQFEYGCVTSEIIGDIAEIGKDKLVFADSRSRISDYRGCVLKPNEVEACRFLGADLSMARDTDYMIKASGQMLEATQARMILLTLGERGVICRDSRDAKLIPACRAEPPVDTVGAGDSFLGAFALAYFLTGDSRCAAYFAGLVAAIVIKKLHTTGSASPDEIREAYGRYFGAR